MVEHCGGVKRDGNFVPSLELADIASGWTECIAMPVRNQSLIVAGFAKTASQLPFAMLGIDTDNDSAFRNQTVLDYCKENGLVQTRSRAYKKNDNAWVEQKNGCDRLLALPKVTAASKAALREQFKLLDPVLLLQPICDGQRRLAELTRAPSDEPVTAPGKADVASFLQSLSTAWMDGEVRATHRTQQKLPSRSRGDVEGELGFCRQHGLLDAAVAVIAGLLRRVALLFQVMRQLSLKHSFCKRFFQLAAQAGICEHRLRVARVYALKQFVAVALSIVIRILSKDKFYRMTSSTQKSDGLIRTQPALMPQQSRQFVVGIMSAAIW